MDMDETSESRAAVTEDVASSYKKNIGDHQLAGRPHTDVLEETYAPSQSPEHSTIASPHVDVRTPGHDEVSVPETPRNCVTGADLEPERSRTPVNQTASECNSAASPSSTSEALDHSAAPHAATLRPASFRSPTSPVSTLHPSTPHLADPHPPTPRKENVALDASDLTKESIEVTSTPPNARGHVNQTHSSSDGYGSYPEAVTNDVDEQELRRSASVRSFEAQSTAIAPTRSVTDVQSETSHAFDGGTLPEDGLSPDRRPEPPQTASVASPASQATSRDDLDVAEEAAASLSPLSSPRSFPSPSSVTEPPSAEIDLQHATPIPSSEGEERVGERISPTLRPLSPSTELSSARNEAEDDPRDRNMVSSPQTSRHDREQSVNREGSQAGDTRPETHSPSDGPFTEIENVSDIEEDASVPVAHEVSDDACIQVSAARSTSDGHPPTDMGPVIAEEPHDSPTLDWTSRTGGDATGSPAEDDADIFDISSSADEQSSPLGRKTQATGAPDRQSRKSRSAGLVTHSARETSPEAPSRDISSIEGKGRMIRDSYEKFKIAHTRMLFSPTADILNPMLLCTTKKTQNAVLTARSHENLVKQRDQILQSLLGPMESNVDGATASLQAESRDLDLIRELCGMFLTVEQGTGITAAMEQLCRARQTSEDRLRLIEFQQHSVLAVAFQHDQALVR